MADQFPDATKMVLSPAAQSVLAAIQDVLDATAEISPRTGSVAAAALRAAADQLSYGHGGLAGTSAIIDEDKLLAIATELEST